MDVIRGYSPSIHKTPKGFNMIDRIFNVLYIFNILNINHNISKHYNQ